VAAEPAREADARRATSGLYHVASAVLLAWEGATIHEARGDARRLVLSRLVVDHRLTGRDPFASDAGARESRAGELLLGQRSVSLADAAALADEG
jgi:acyl-CoA dehydrogenase